MSPAVRSTGQEFEMRLAPSDFGRLLREVKAFDAEFYKATRKRLRDAGAEAVKAVKRRITSGPSQRNTGLRRGLAAGTKLSLRTGQRVAGMSIVTSGAKLPTEKQAMVRAYNKRSFRHPVFPHPQGERNSRTAGAQARYATGQSRSEHDWRWVTQTGRPYFGFTLDERKGSMQHAVEQALADAARTIRSGEVHAA